MPRGPAGREHAGFLAQLARHTDLLRRQVLLVLREPTGPATAADGLGGPTPGAVLASLLRGGGSGASHPGNPARRAAEARLMRRLGEAVELLSPAGIVVTPLDAERATAVLTVACNPASTRPPAPDMARPADVITRGAPAAGSSQPSRTAPGHEHARRPAPGWPGHGHRGRRTPRKLR